MSLEPLLTASPVIQVHAAAALAAFVIGGLVLFRRKGDARHKTLGRIWVGLMALVAISSLFIWEIRMLGPFSPIHILSIVTLAGLWRAIRHARARNITAHRRLMQSLYLGALVVAGFFTFMPGRIMHDVVFGPGNGTLAQWALFLIVFATCLAGGYAILSKRMGWRMPHLT